MLPITSSCKFLASSLLDVRTILLAVAAYGATKPSNREVVKSVTIPFPCIQCIDNIRQLKCMRASCGDIMRLSYSLWKEDAIW